MKALIAVATVSLVLAGALGSASADPGKDESGKGRYRDTGRAYSSEMPRREARAFKQEFDDGTCKYERKLEKSGEYKEQTKCRAPGRR